MHSLKTLRTPHNTGIVSGLLATLCWGSSFIASSYLFRPEWRVDPVSLIVYRFAIGGTFMMICAVIGKKKLYLSKDLLLRCGATAFFMQLLMSFFYFSAQKYMPAATAALCLESGPLMGMVIFTLLTGRCRSWHIPVASAGCLLGAMLVLNVHQTGVSAGMLTGVLLMCCSVTAWLIGSAFFKKAAAGNDALVISSYCQLMASLMALPLMLINFPMTTIVPQGSMTWVAILLMGAVPTGLGYLFWSSALKHLSLTETGVIQNLTPVFALLGGAMLLHEPITWSNCGGILLVIISLIFALRFRSGPRSEK